MLFCVPCFTVSQFPVILLITVGCITAESSSTIHANSGTELTHSVLVFVCGMQIILAPVLWSCENYAWRCWYTRFSIVRCRFHSGAINSNCLLELQLCVWLHCNMNWSAEMSVVEMSVALVEVVHYQPADGAAWRNAIDDAMLHTPEMLR